MRQDQNPIPTSSCNRTGIALWLSVAALVLFLVWLSGAEDTPQRAAAAPEAAAPRGAGH